MATCQGGGGEGFRRGSGGEDRKIVGKIRRKKKYVHAATGTEVATATDTKAGR